MSTKTLHSLTPIALSALTYTDLRDEAIAPAEVAPDDAQRAKEEFLASHPGLAAFRGYEAREDGTPAAQALEALVVGGRIGIADGADAQWADMGDRSARAMVELYLSDGEAYAALA
jgi:hypothetical protein